MSDQSPHADDPQDYANELIRQRRKFEKARVVNACEKLDPRALEVLADIAERLAKGAEQYGGDFDHKPRDWHEEQYQEIADALVYGAMAQIKRREEKRADEARAKAAERSHRLGEYSDWAKEYGPETARDGAWPTTARTGVDFVDNG